jgi:AcrR family transcriptional regulator
MAGRSERRRHSAEERRELVLEAAREEFGRSGFAGSTGEAIAFRAGITHPYLLRLFGSKKDLFLAVVERTFDELMTALREGGDAGSRGSSMAALEGTLSSQFEADGAGPALLLQMVAACEDEEIRLVVRRRLAELFEHVGRATGAKEDEVAALLGRLLLRDAASALRLPDLAGRELWARRLMTAVRRS